MVRPARALAGALEPVTGQVYFAPECHENYRGLGFDPSPGLRRGVAAPEMVAYFTSRGSILGQVPGELVAAAFGVFNPAVVVPAVRRGWTLSDAVTVQKARTAGARAQLVRV
ncbi:helix-turn-helix domain-containing protein, partial [Pseudonocardia pini]|uniref:helix-turn-helix domain-containing protein n=1 Tax=Pseudonocardia pini TaxID=2758030 RepID=UPI00406BA457